MSWRTASQTCPTVTADRSTAAGLHWLLVFDFLLLVFAGLYKRFTLGLQTAQLQIATILSGSHLILF
jgi:hypothetical protein